MSHAGIVIFFLTHLSPYFSEYESISSNKSGSIAEQFAKWRKQRAQEQAAGRKTNKEGVTAYDLLESWEEFLE